MKLQNLPSYNLERVWCCTALKGSNSVAVGYDEGTILIKMGRDEPAVTMDVNGKLIWARHSELCQGTISQIFIFKTRSLVKHLFGRPRNNKM